MRAKESEMQLKQVSTVSVPTDEYNRLRAAVDLLRELRDAMVAQDFFHWRKAGRQVWIERIDVVVGEEETLSSMSDKDRISKG
jgi:hypothetical protein